MVLLDNSDSPSGPDTQTRRVGRKTRRVGEDDAQPTKRAREFQSPSLGPVPGSISELVSQTNASPVPRAWESANNHLNATLVASPSPIPKSRESYGQLARQVLENHPYGLTSNEISLRVIQSLGSDIERKKARGAITAALSSGAKGERPMFEKRPPDNSGKVRWALKAHNSDSSSHPTDGLLEESFVTGELDSTVIVSAPHEQGPCGPPPSTANGPMNDIEDQVVEDSPETHEDVASSRAAEILNSVITDQSPHADMAERSAAAPVTETSQQADLQNLQDLQQISSSAVDVPAELPAPEPRLSAHESRQAASQITPGPRVGYELPTQEKRTAVDAESTMTASRGVQGSSVFQDLASKGSLHPSLGALVNNPLENFIGCMQRWLEEIRNRFSSQLQKRNDAYSDSDCQALLERFWKDASLGSSPAQHAGTIKDAHQELDKLERAQCVKMQVEGAIALWNSERTMMNVVIDELRRSVDGFDPSRDLLQAYKMQAAASEEDSRKRIGAFINQDHNHQNVD